MLLASNCGDPCLVVSTTYDPKYLFHSGNTGSNLVTDGSTFEAVPRVFGRNRQLRERRDTVKTEATAAEKD